jgi:phage terminase large subunit-like protein
VNSEVGAALADWAAIDWRKRFVPRAIWYDPYQMQASAQCLAKAGMPIEEYPQTVPNLTAATSNLFDLIQNRSIALYSDAAMRLAVSRAIIVESSRGWRLDKLKQQHKIDVVVALSMACLAAVRGQGKPGYDLFAPGLHDDSADERYRRELGAHIYACTGIWPR